MRPDGERRWTGGAAALVACCLGASAALAGPALAAFSAEGSGTASYTSAVLADPTDLTAVIRSCTPNQLAEVELNWDRTASGFADGYEVRRAADGQPEQVIGLVTDADVTIYVDATVAFSTTYTYRVVATASWWLSPGETAAAISTPPLSCGGGGPGGGGPGGGGPGGAPPGGGRP